MNEYRYNQQNVRPSKNNINLMISLNEMEDQIIKMQKYDLDKVTLALKKINNFSYEITDEAINLDSIVVLNKEQIFQLIEIESLAQTRLNDKLRIELKRNNGYWEQDMGDSNAN